MSNLDLKKFNRILSIYMQLQSRNWITAEQLSERYEVSIRTIYRDIKSLEAAGVPIFNEVGKGYALVDGYKMPPTLFTKHEALSFAAAERLMQKYVDGPMSHHFSSALHKMKAVLKSNEKESVSVLEDQLLMIASEKTSTNKDSIVLTALFESISNKKKIEIEYVKINSKQGEVRLLEPIGVFHENEYWYFMAFCYLRNDYRQFRIDRVKKIHVLTDGFDIKHKSLSHFITEKQNELPQTQEIVIAVNKELASYLHWERAHFGFVREEVFDDVIKMYFETAHTIYFARWFLMFADFSKIIEPDYLKIEVASLAERVFKNSMK